jgi:hypothetical protein
MKLECMVRREGTTPVLHDGVNYKFEPILEYDFEGNIIPGPTTGLCEVQNEDHIKYFLAAGHGTQFKAYVPRPLIRATKEEKNIMVGFSFDRHLDGTSGAGYIVVDRIRNRFGGTNGWGERKDRISFVSLIDAAAWLKEEAPILSAEEEEKERDRIEAEEKKKKAAAAPATTAAPGSEVKKFSCPGCSSGFDTSLELARHAKTHTKGE